MLIAVERRKLDLDRLIADDDEPAIAAITAAELGVGVELATGRRKLNRQAFVDDLLGCSPSLRTTSMSLGPTPHFSQPYGAPADLEARTI